MGGPPPQLPVAEYLLGASPTATRDDVPDDKIQADLKRVCIYCFRNEVSKIALLLHLL